MNFGWSICEGESDQAVVIRPCPTNLIPMLVEHLKDTAVGMMLAALACADSENSRVAKLAQDLFGECVEASVMTELYKAEGRLGFYFLTKTLDALQNKGIVDLRIFKLHIAAEQKLVALNLENDNRALKIHGWSRPAGIKRIDAARSYLPVSSHRIQSRVSSKHIRDPCNGIV